MSNLIPFTFENTSVRMFEEDGKVFFCGKDVATALGYVNTKDALAKHYKGVTKRYPLQTAGGVQQVRFITEGDLYRLIASSKLPSAQAFEAKVFDEILPTIRKTGSYGTPRQLTGRELMAAASDRIESNGRKGKERTASGGSQDCEGPFAGEVCAQRSGNGCLGGRSASSRNSGRIADASQFNLPDHFRRLVVCTPLCAYVKLAHAHKSVHQSSNKNRATISPKLHRTVAQYKAARFYQAARAQRKAA